ncbi:MAG TPA: ribosome silencing factor [Longimicrobiales bacterium]|nr:ribosome silencing factor [Longimicrobiales bacterium]
MNRENREAPVAGVDRQSGPAGNTNTVVAGTDAGTLPAELARATGLAADRKANDLLVLDLRGISNATDYFFLASGTSDMHVRSIAEHIIEELKKEGVRAAHVEGLRSGRWVLLDYIDFVVHVFHPAAREFYQLERLWGDAPAYAIEA